MTDVVQQIEDIKGTQNIGGSTDGLGVEGGKVQKGPSSKEEILLNHPNMMWTCSPEFDDIYYNWNTHLKQFESNQSVEFRENRYKIAKIPHDNLTKLHNSLKKRNKVTFSISDCSPDFVASEMGKRKAIEWATHLPNFDFSETEIGIIKNIGYQLKPIVESCIGNFKIINTKASETLPSSGAFGPNAPHTDSKYPKGTYKAFIYLTPPNKIEGTTVLHIPRKVDTREAHVEQVFVEGELGTFLFFDPVHHCHCGIVPHYPKVRMMLEFIIVPNSKTIINPKFNGTNSTHPIDPNYV